MKRLIIFSLFFLFLTNYVTATATVCTDDTKTDCIRYTQVSYDGGQTYYDACCSDFQNAIDQGYWCEDDCQGAKSRFEDEPTSVPRMHEGIKWEYLDESNNLIKHTVEFTNNKIYLDGKIVAEFLDGVTNVIVELPNFPLFVGLKNSVNKKRQASPALQNLVKAASQSEVKVYDRNPQIKIYPNPTIDGRLTLSSSQLITSVDVYNSYGVHVKSSSRNFVTKGNKQFELDLSHLDNGVYFLQIQVYRNAKKIQGKVIIQKL